MTQQQDRRDLGPAEFLIGGYRLSDIVRRVRRQADMSQRELAKHAKVSAALIGGIESGTAVPSLPTLQRIFNAANFLLAAIDAHGRLAAPLEVWSDTADGAGRRYPAQRAVSQWEVRVAQYRDAPRPEPPIRQLLTR